MFWIYNKKIESTKIKNSKTGFDIRDGLDANQRTILLAIKFLCDDYYDCIPYEHGFSIEQIKNELKLNKLTDETLAKTVQELTLLKYPLLALNSRQEICITRFFDKMFEGQNGTDCSPDFILASAFPNFICNGGQGYLPHDISDAINAIRAFIQNRNIPDEEIHKILKDDSDKDLKKIVEAFANHRISILGRLNRIEYDRYDTLSRILKSGSPKEIQKLGATLPLEKYEELKKELIAKYGNINQLFIDELQELTERV